MPGIINYGPATEIIHLISYKKINKAVKLGCELGLEVHAGHGLTTKSVKVISKIDQITEFNIGHSLISESLFVGLKKSIINFKRALNK